MLKSFQEGLVQNLLLITIGLLLLGVVAGQLYTISELKKPEHIINNPTPSASALPSVEIEKSLAPSPQASATPSASPRARR